MRSSPILLLALAVFLWAGGAHAQGQTPARDLELTGRAIGPLPVRPGVDSQFVLTVRNLGPNATVRFTRTLASWPFGRQRVIVVGQSGPPCLVIVPVDVGDPFPPEYSLDVLVTEPIPPGAAVSCPFIVRTDLPLEPEAVLSFTAYDDNFVLQSDPIPSNNTVVFGIGAPFDTRVPTTNVTTLVLLAIGLLLGGYQTRRRVRRPRAR